MAPERILIVGCGPGSAEHLTGAARAAVAEADWVLGPPRLQALFPEVSGERLVTAPGPVESLARLATCGGTAAVLVTGDPGFFSLGKRAVERFGRERCRIVPGVSSLQLACARLGLPWGEARIVSAHAGAPALAPEALAGEPTVAVLAGNPASDPWVLAAARALAPTHRAFALRDLGLPTERVAEVPADALADELGPGRVIVVLTTELAPAAGAGGDDRTDPSDPPDHPPQEPP